MFIFRQIRLSSCLHCAWQILSCYILACVDRLALWRVIAWDQAQHWGKGKKRGTAKKKMASKTSRGMVSSLRSPFFSPFLPTFL